MATSSSTSVFLQPYEWSEASDHSGYTINAACHTRDSIMVQLRITGFTPFCRIELPTIIDGTAAHWTQKYADIYIKWLCDVLKDDAPLKSEFSYESKLHYYQDTKFPFLTCHFLSVQALHHCTAFLKKKPRFVNPLNLTVPVQIMEQKVSNFHKFMVASNFTYTGWLEIRDPQYIPEPEKLTWAPLELEISIDKIICVPMEISRDWIVHPRVGAIDLECYSANPLAMPNPLHISDVVFQISYIDQILGKPETRKKYVIQLGGCADTPGVTIIRVKEEMEIFDKLSELILKCNPAIICGYNIFRFDFPYIDDRMKHYMKDTLKSCGVIKEETTKINVYTWKSSAYGFVVISSLSTFGRIYLDMLPIIKRDYKLNKYTLDFVSNYFLGRGKHDVSPQEIFAAYKETVAAEKEYNPNETNLALLYHTSQRLEAAYEKMGKIALYCAEDSCLCIDLMEKLNTWLNIIILANIVQVTPVSTFSRGQQLRVLNQLYSRCYKSGIVMDTREEQNLEFTGAIVVNSVVGTHENMMVFDFASLYPSVIIEKNVCYTTLVHPERTDVPDSHCHVCSWDEEVEVTTLDAEGEEVQTTKTVHYHHRFIRQEYRKGIIPQICEDLVNERVKVKNQIGPQNDALKNLILDILQNVLKVSANSVYGGLSARFGLPLIEGARVVTYCGRQLNLHCQKVAVQHGMKVLAGDTDSIMTVLDPPIRDPRLCKKVGESFAKTLTAEFHKPLRVEYEKTYAIVILLKRKMYSGISLVTIMKNNVVEVEKCEFKKGWENDKFQLLKVTHKNKGKTEMVHLLFPSDLNHEDWVDDCIAGIPVSAGGEKDEKKITNKGIIIARRDNCVWVRNAYMKILTNILFRRPIQESLNVINESILNMMSRSVHYRELLINKEIGSEYKPGSTYPMCIFAQELKKRGVVIEGGERIDYLIVRIKETKEKKVLQGMKMRLLNDFLENCHQEPVDTMYYIEGQLKNRVQSLLQVGYMTEFSRIPVKTVQYRQKQKRRSSMPTHLCEKFLENYCKFLKEKQKVIQHLNLLSEYIQSLGPFFEKGLASRKWNYREIYFWEE